MKTIKVLTIIFGILFTFNLQAQKVKIKKGIAYVDGVEYVKVERESGDMSIYSIQDDEEIIFIKYHDPTPNNKQNMDSYDIVRFVDFDVEVELKETRKKIIKMLYKGKVIKDGKIDKDRLKKFVTKYGSDESRGKLFIQN
ncbi:hypothetical protein [uncultured Winogradskyella sp.]|uniref:hypothetical protein n=1 Tax=uncultured Winogradskyella sp. TaxID=395353 RepID=UPI00262F077E|nr:hypothetical protein [uncultured Winogradskyella sp.]